MRLIKGLSTAALLAICLVVIPAQGASASAFHLEVNNAVLDLGNIKMVRAIDSTATPPDPAATLDGTLTGNAVEVPKAGFVFHTKTTSVSGVQLKIDLDANEDITGKFDRATGRTDLDFNLKATVRATLGSEEQTCVISPIEVSVSTDKAYPYLGVRFTDGPGGPGAIGGSWEDLPQPSGGPICSIVGQVIAGPGGIWMSHDLVDPLKCADEPTHTGCPGYEDPCETGDTSACCEQEPDRAGCRDTDPAKLSLKLKPRSVKAKTGKKVRFKVRVKNSGDATARRLKICVKAPKRLVKVKRCVERGSLAAGKSRTVTFKLKIKKKAKGRIKVTFKASSRGIRAARGKGVIRVKRS